MKKATLIFMLLICTLIGCSNIKSEEDRCQYNDMFWGTTKENIIKEKGEPVVNNSDNSIRYYELYMGDFFYVSYCFDEQDKLNEIKINIGTSIEYGGIRNMLTEKFGEPSDEMIDQNNDGVKIADWFVGNTHISAYDIGGECDIWYSACSTNDFRDDINNSLIIDGEINIVTTQETTYQETTTETTTLDYLSMGDSGTVSKSQITFDNVVYDTVLYTDDGYHTISAKDNCQYVLTYITIKNIGNEGISFRWINNDFYCSLLTSDGLEYSPSTFFPYINDSLENMSLNPLEEKSGFVGFSVPDEVINSDRDLYLVCSGYPDEVKFRIR